MRVLVALSFVALVGCSLALDPKRHMPDEGVDAGSVDAGARDAEMLAPLSAGNVCPEFARVLCEGRALCCPPAPDNCLAALTATCVRVVGPIVLETNTMYDPTRGAELLRDAEAMAEMCNPEILHILADRGGIRSALRGSFTEGQPCEATDGELLDQAYARFFTCSAGFGCRDEGAAGWFCRALVPPDLACDYDYDCADDMQCSALGVCADRQGNGTACDHPTQCASLVCDTSCQRATVINVWCSDAFEVLTRL